MPFFTDKVTGTACVEPTRVDPPIRIAALSSSVRTGRLGRPIADRTVSRPSLAGLDQALLELGWWVSTLRSARRDRTLTS